MTGPDPTTRPHVRRVPPWEDIPAEQQTPPLFDIPTSAISPEQEDPR